MQTIAKWSVSVLKSNGEKVNFAISDNHYSNVLRTISIMDFGLDAIEIVIHNISVRT